MANATADEIRLLLVEDVPQVAQYIRSLLTAQSSIKLLDVVTDGTKALRQIEQLRPDVVLIDSLLQGRVKGMQLVDQVRRGEQVVPVVVLTVPQNPVDTAPEKGIHGVLSMPFSGFDLNTRINAVYNEFHQADSTRTGKIVTVFAPKGGVGKTTIAFNLAVSAGRLDQRTVLIDGSLQFGDLRALLKVPVDAPSLLDLPTDRIQEQDLKDVLWRDPSGVDILLAPPRIEMAEMVTTRDIEKMLSLLRRVYQVIIIDMPAALSEQSLAFLDHADIILEIVTFDSTTLRNTLAIAETFRAIGYKPEKIQYLLNRADSAGGMTIEDMRRTLGRPPDHTVVSDGMLVVQSNNEGVPFVLANPNAAISLDIGRIASRVFGLERARSGRSQVTYRLMADARPIGVFDSGVGGLTVLREILRRLPGESTIYLGDNARAPYGTRSDDEVRSFSRQSLDALADNDVKAIVVACNTSTAVSLTDLRRRYDLPILGVIRPGASAAALATRTRRVGVIATPATVRSHAYFHAIKDENPAVEVYEHATPALVPLVESGELSGEHAEATVRDALAPLLGTRDGAGEFIFPLPASARIDTLLLGCTHYPLLKPLIEAAGGEGVAIVDSATATASALAELLSVNGLEAPEFGQSGARTHVQLTTGDVAQFRALAARLFGGSFADVSRIELAEAVS